MSVRRCRRRRPYRAALPPEEVRRIIRGQAGWALCPEAIEALEGVGIRHDERPVPPIP